MRDPVSGQDALEGPALHAPAGQAVEAGGRDRVADQPLPDRFRLGGQHGDDLRVVPRGGRHW